MLTLHSSFWLDLRGYGVWFGSKMSWQWGLPSCSKQKLCQGNEVWRTSQATCRKVYDWGHDWRRNDDEARRHSTDGTWIVKGELSRGARMKSEAVSVSNKRSRFDKNADGRWNFSKFPSKQSGLCAWLDRTFQARMKLWWRWAASKPVFDDEADDAISVVPMLCPQGHEFFLSPMKIS